MMTHADSPLRLVNVLEGGSVKLEKMGGRRVAYAALSYCWGDSPGLELNKTTMENVTSRFDPFPLDKLPHTLQEAVRMTRSLRIAYLWIDALCIVQDCEEEWKSEAQRMMKYYAAAYVTIVPLMSDSADTGLRMQCDRRYYKRFTGPWSNYKDDRLVLLCQA